MKQDKQEIVRLLVLQHGLQKASELSGVPYDLVRQWESRRKRREKPFVTNVTKQVTDRVASEIAENNRETKLSLTRSARRMAKDSEQATLREAGLVHKVGQLHAILDPVEAKANTILNVAILTGQEEPEKAQEPQTIDLPYQDSGQ